MGAILDHNIEELQMLRLRLECGWFDGADQGLRRRLRREASRLYEQTRLFDVEGNDGAAK